jgi:hypothetical protein
MSLWQEEDDPKGVLWYKPMVRLGVRRSHRRLQRGKWMRVGLLVDSEIVLSTRYGKVRVFINNMIRP